MADGLEITSDLTSQFAQLGDIKTVTARLSSRLDQISRENLQAAGTDDDYAKAYHKNVDANQQNLVDLVDGIGSLFETTGDNGQAVAKSFDTVNDESGAVVRSMDFDAIRPTSSFAAPLSPAVASSEVAATPTRTARMRAIPATPLSPLNEDVPARAERMLATRATPVSPRNEDVPARAERMLATPAEPAHPLSEPLTNAYTDRMLAVPAEPLARLREDTPAPVDEP